MVNELESLLRRELKGVSGAISPVALALCRIFEHQLYLRDRAHADLMEQWREQGKRITELEMKGGKNEINGDDHHLNAAGCNPPEAKPSEERIDYDQNHNPR